MSAWAAIEVSLALAMQEQARARKNMLKVMIFEFMLYSLFTQGFQKHHSSILSF
jgi:hypothetical protein